jgi:hypothetical protein
MLCDMTRPGDSESGIAAPIHRSGLYTRDPARVRSRRNIDYIPARDARRWPDQDILGFKGLYGNLGADLHHPSGGNLEEVGGVAGGFGERDE